MIVDCFKRLTVAVYIPLLLIALPVQAEIEYIDSMIAIVEDDVITNNELQAQALKIQQEMRGQGRNIDINTAVYRQVLDLMINESILYQEAKKRGVTVTDTQLNNTLQNLAARNKLTLEGFRSALIDQGIDYNSFRDDLRKKMMINTLQASYARQNVEVTEQEIDEFIQRNGEDFESLEYRLSHILVAVPDGASSEQVNEARQNVEMIQQRLAEGESFSELAKQYSAGGTALDGGDLGWRKLAEIPSLFTPLMQQMTIDDVSEPQRAASGYHIVKMTGKRDAEQHLVKQINARHILIQPDQITTDQQAREKLQSIRQQIIDGADFGALAKQYSNDPGSKGLGGDLGWFEPHTMVEAFENKLRETPPGIISEVFRSEFGWHILEVLGEKTIDETEESKRNKIREQLTNQKRDEVLDLWQRRLRDEAFVKVLQS